MGQQAVGNMGRARCEGLKRNVICEVQCDWSSLDTNHANKIEMHIFIAIFLLAHSSLLLTYLLDT